MSHDFSGNGDSNNVNNDKCDNDNDDNHVKIIEYDTIIINTKLVNNNITSTDNNEIIANSWSWLYTYAVSNDHKKKPV